MLYIIELVPLPEGHVHDVPTKVAQLPLLEQRLACWLLEQQGPYRLHRAQKVMARPIHLKRHADARSEQSCIETITGAFAAMSFSQLVLRKGTRWIYHQLKLPPAINRCRLPLVQSA